MLGNGANLRNIDNNYTNARFVIDNNIFQAATNRILSSGYLSVTPFDGLSIRTQIATDYTAVRDFQSLDPRHGDGRGSNGYVFQASREVIRWNWQNIINYDHMFNNAHNVNLTLGNENQKTTA